jgi:hypothetical protein
VPPAAVAVLEIQCFTNLHGNASLGQTSQR